MTTAIATHKHRLSPREAQVTRHIARGETDKQIARLLHCAPSTIKTHAEHARLKLRAENRAHLVARAYDAGVLYAKVLFLALLTIHTLNTDIDMRAQRVGTRITRTARNNGRKAA